MKSLHLATPGIVLGLLASLQEISAMRATYEARISELERNLEQYADRQQLSSIRQNNAVPSDNSFNPQLSIILDGQVSAYNNDPEDYELPGFMLGGEAGLAAEGGSLGHTEIAASASIDDKFFGKVTLAVADHEGETEIELEEAWFETLGLGGGLTLRAGRFFPATGYLNKQHKHAWDFVDAPLVHLGLWGANYIDDGLRLSWIAPADLFVELGADLLAGGGFPAGGARSGGSGAQVYFLNLGGDLGASHSWQAGISHFRASVEDRESGGHGHGHTEHTEETLSFTGDSKATGINLVYKWAPNGNYKNRNFKLQGEYFTRDEDGQIELEGSDPLEFTSLRGEQSGYYLQAVYQFRPQWRTGIRYDHLSSNNRGSDVDVLAEAGLLDEGMEPGRWNGFQASSVACGCNTTVTSPTWRQTISCCCNTQ